MKASSACSLAIVAILAVGNSASAVVLTDTQEQTDFSGYIPPTLAITANPFDFSGQDYTALKTLESLTIELTVRDGDTALGQSDYEDWTLGLDGVDTGLLLNGFRKYETDTLEFTLAFTQSNDDVLKQGQILDNLLADGELIATIIDRDTAYPIEYGNWLELCENPTHYARLDLTGSPVPEPSTFAIWSVLGASAAGLAWRRRRKA